MTHRFEWLVERRLVRLEIFGSISFDELRAISASIVEQCDTGIAPVHSVIDVRGVDHYPKNLTELASAFKTKPSSKLGWIMLITDNTLIRFLGSVIIQLSGQRFSAFADYPAALTYLARRDDTLDLHPLIERFSRAD